MLLSIFHPNLAWHSNLVLSLWRAIEVSHTWHAARALYVPVLVLKRWLHVGDRLVTGNNRM